MLNVTSNLAFSSNILERFEMTLSSVALIGLITHTLSDNKEVL